MAGTDDAHSETGTYTPQRGGSGFEDSQSPFIVQSLQIGQCLLQRQAVTDQQLTQALKRQSISGLRLGEELISAGDIRPFDFYRALADQRGSPFINLLLSPPDPNLLDTHDIGFYLQHQCLPWKAEGPTPAYVAVDLDAASAALEEKTGLPFLLYQTAPLDILRTVQTAFGSDLTERAQFSLSQKTPSASARRLLPPTERMVFMCLWCFLVATVFLFPAHSFLALNIATVIAFMSLALLRLLSVWFTWRSGGRLPPANIRTQDRDLPLYTVMVPLLREAEILPILIDALQKLDYPHAKLDIKIVLEETDHTTIGAVRAMALPGNIQLILVPPSHPMTKPKACNYALPFARGDLLVVYDAEDIPGPGQLREAVHAFKAGGPQLACVQAPLAYYNWNENWLTRHFAIEYAALFDLLLPALARFGLPFPLGGTSTHFRTFVLRKVGAWDPFNVTEDADLGFRLCEQGYTTNVISTATLEEANCLLPNWVRQRSRWLKGWMQTYIVHMRQPARTYTALGPAGFLVLQIVTGGFLLSALAHPIFYILLIWIFAAGVVPTDTLGPFVMGLLNLSVLLVGFSAAMIAGLVGAQTRGLSGLAFHILTMPAYWLLISAGAFKALHQLIFKPHYWEKTDHGVSAMVPAYIARARLMRSSANKTP